MQVYVHVHRIWINMFKELIHNFFFLIWAKIHSLINLKRFFSKSSWLNFIHIREYKTQRYQEEEGAKKKNEKKRNDRRLQTSHHASYQEEEGEATPNKMAKRSLGGVIAPSKKHKVHIHVIFY
jgi:hypothetical protein